MYQKYLKICQKSYKKMPKNNIKKKKSQKVLKNAKKYQKFHFGKQGGRAVARGRGHTNICGPKDVHASNRFRRLRAHS